MMSPTACFLRTTVFRVSAVHALLVLLVILITGPVAFPCGAADPRGGTGGGPILGSLHVRVVYNGSTDPVAGAFVMVGDQQGRPFPGNTGLTSANGDITFSHPDLSGPVSVTAGLAGYQYFTFAAVDAADVVIPLTPASSSNTNYQVGDYVSGIDVDNGWFHAGDGNLDLAFVLPALSIDDIMSFDTSRLFGPPETIYILGNPVEVPSNMFIPQQWEIFVEIKKDFYHLYLPAGNFTLGALSCRVPLDAVLAGGPIEDLVPLLDWRETDILDVSITGDTNNADLTVDPNLDQTITLNLDNVPDASVAWCISVGDLDARHGLGRLMPLGLNSLERPAGSGTGGGTVHLTSTAPSGEFSGIDYHPVVAVQMVNSNDMLVITDRASHPQSYTEGVSSFFRQLNLLYAPGLLYWNDAQNPAGASPPVDVQIARIAETDGTAVYWEFTIPGGETLLTIPRLPFWAPAGPVARAGYTWQQVALGLAFDLPTFDFDEFPLSDIAAHASHVALDSMEIVWADNRDATARPSRLQ